MYQVAKAVVKRIVPVRVLGRYGDRLRRAAAFFYRGDAVRCVCCGYAFARFVRLPNGDLLCPRCGSLPRSRKLRELVDDFRFPGARLLHFSPSPGLRASLAAIPDLDYHTTDFAGEFAATYRFDILDIDRPAASYDLILCYHVLEHIGDDRRAIAELYRVLAPGGTCLVQCPFAGTTTYEDPTIVSPAARRRAFGQADHLRVYAAADLAERLRGAGFLAEVRYSPTTTDYDTKGGETLIVARKPADHV